MSSPSDQFNQPSPQATFVLFCSLLCLFAAAAAMSVLAGWVWRDGAPLSAIVCAGLIALTLIAWALVSVRLAGHGLVLLLTGVLVVLHFVGFALPRFAWETPPTTLEETALAGRVLYYLGSASVGLLLACVTVAKNRREVMQLSAVPVGLMLAGAWWVLRDVIDSGQVVTSVGMTIGLLLVALLCFELVSSSAIRRLFANRPDNHFMTELQNAKRVHESMFPEPIAGDDLRFGYAYRPMRQIGGDFIHIHRSSSGAFYLTIVDVTGHGITSALTVNRLHAELRQFFATTPISCPSETLSHLNDYVRVTMAEHGLFATGMCVRLDSSESKLIVANAGHPLCYVRDPQGLTEVDAEGPMLGVFEGEAFDCTPVSFDFSAGDQLVMVTDGAIEARNPADEMLGTQRLHHIIERSCSQSASPANQGTTSSLLQRRMSGRLLDRSDVRKPVGLIQQVMRQRMNLHPCALADEIMLSIDDFVQQENQDDILIATIEMLDTAHES